MRRERGGNAVVSERMLHEYWLPHFKEAIVEGHAQSVMASYNAINGTHNIINHWLLTDVLKDEWHHDGFVVSDLGGVGPVPVPTGPRNHRGRSRAGAHGRLRFCRQGF